VPVSRKLNKLETINSNNYATKGSSSRKRNHDDVDWDIVIQGMTTDAMVISQSIDWMKTNENAEPEKETTTYNKKRYRIDSTESTGDQYNEEGNMNV